MGCGTSKEGHDEKKRRNKKGEKEQQHSPRSRTSRSEHASQKDGASPAAAAVLGSSSKSLPKGEKDDPQTAEGSAAQRATSPAAGSAPPKDPVAASPWLGSSKSKEKKKNGKRTPWENYEPLLKDEAESSPQSAFAITNLDRELEFRDRESSRGSGGGGCADEDETEEKSPQSVQEKMRIVSAWLSDIDLTPTLRRQPASTTTNPSDGSEGVYSPLSPAMEILVPQGYVEATPTSPTALVYAKGGNESQSQQLRELEPYIPAGVAPSPPMHPDMGPETGHPTYIGSSSPGVSSANSSFSKRKNLRWMQSLPAPPGTAPEGRGSKAGSPTESARRRGRKER